MNRDPIQEPQPKKNQGYTTTMNWWKMSNLDFEETSKKLSLLHVVATRLNFRNKI